MSQDYLETKRIAFPRFYFVAPADLLDILSKGSNPQAILRHLSKCFDNVHNLSFRMDERGEPTKVCMARLGAVPQLYLERCRPLAQLWQPCFLR